MVRSEYGYPDEYILSKSNAWIAAAVNSILARKHVEMQWQVILTTLAQPVFTDEAIQERSDMLDRIFNLLQGNEIEDLSDEPMNDEDTVALLEMAGRKIIRKLDARS